MLLLLELLLHLLQLLLILHLLHLPPHPLLIILLLLDLLLHPLLLLLHLLPVLGLDSPQPQHHHCDCPNDDTPTDITPRLRRDWAALWAARRNTYCAASHAIRSA